MSRANRGVRTAVVLGLGLMVCLVGGAWLAAAIVAWAEGAPGGWADAILRKGPSTVARRTMTILILPVLPWLLREARWGGWRDLGWQSPGGAPGTAGIELGRGLAVGVATLGCVILLQLLSGTRVPAPESNAGDVLRLGGLAVSAVGVALFEETLVRGILFRVLARVWGVGAAAVVLSGLFALGHFLRPARAAFDSPGTAGAVLASSLAAVGQALAQEPIQVALLFLMSLVLCLSVARRGSIWLAVGLHAAWVWLKRVNSAWMDSSEVSGIRRWLFGVRPDGLDALATVVILGLLAWVLAVGGRRRVPSDADKDA